MDIIPKKFLIDCFESAVMVVNPHNILKKYLPNDRSGSVLVISVGKAAASMAAAFENAWNGPIKGIAVTRYGHKENCRFIEVIEASHPIPDETSLIATKHILKVTENLDKKTKIFFLVSGGGSSLLSMPANNISYSEKISISKSLLSSGATINEINTVRKHLSTVKGGRFAVHCYPASIYTYAISDVMGDDPFTIASGPTVGDNRTSQEALDILERYDIRANNSVYDWLKNPNSETIKPNDARLKKSEFSIISSAKDALSAAEKFAKTHGIKCINLGECGGEARHLGKSHAEYVYKINNDKPVLIISGGETTVTVRGSGKGGRNSEYLLSLALYLKDNKNIYALAADTDGIDGSEDNAGAYIDPTTINRAYQSGINLENMLDNNDAYSAFKKLDDLIITGPTRTNVNDFRAILVMPSINVR